MRKDSVAFVSLSSYWCNRLRILLLLVLLLVIDDIMIGNAAGFVFDIVASIYKKLYRTKKKRIAVHHCELSSSMICLKIIPRALVLVVIVEVRTTTKCWATTSYCCYSNIKKSLVATTNGFYRRAPPVTPVPLPSVILLLLI